MRTLIPAFGLMYNFFSSNDNGGFFSAFNRAYYAKRTLWSVSYPRRFWSFWLTDDLTCLSCLVLPSAHWSRLWHRRNFVMLTCPSECTQRVHTEIFELFSQCPSITVYIVNASTHNASIVIARLSAVSARPRYQSLYQRHLIFSAK